MSTPQFTGPDGVGRESLAFSTTLGSRFFTGTMDADTVDMEVSIRGAAYTSDPDLILFEGTSFTLPNPAAYPDGLDLQAGVNTIRLRSISTSGAVSGDAVAEVSLIQERDVGIVATAPTNVTVEQFDRHVTITVEVVDDSNFRGFNFYASKYAGGGASGYLLINVDLVQDGTTGEEVASLGTIESDADVALDSAGDHAADPLYVTILGTQTDADDALLQTDFTDTVLVPETVGKVRVTATVESVRETTFYTFNHSRTANSSSTPATISVGSFAATPSTEPLYYVVAAVYYDSDNRVEVESSFSPEVAARPLRVSTTVGNFPVVTRQQINRDVIGAIQRSNPHIRVDPGSYLRDTFIDPFGSEAERLRFILDFLHRASSFAGLLAIDDPTATGSSVDVAASTYKQALKKAFHITKDSDVQALIDRMFEARASDYGVTRLAGKFARGEVTFYTTSKPTKSLPVALGAVVSGGSTSFKVTRAGTIKFESLASYYNPVTGRYSITVPIQATTVGSTGNIGAGQIRTVTSGAPGLSCINVADTFGGDDLETNRQMAERARNALASVDSGTERGYLQAAAGTPGVVQAKVISSGNPLMHRDLDSSGAHRGGKVDIWVQGENLGTVTDTFAFTFKIANNIQFEVVGDPDDLTFRAVDSTLSQTNPIVEMLDDEDAGYELVNATTGEVFDLTGVTISSYDTIVLDTDLDQPTVSLSDVIFGDYRYRTGSQFEFPRQPVASIVSVTGAVSGELDAAAYALWHPNAPLEKGRSTSAGDYLLITGTTDDDGNLVPSGNTIDITDEEHVVVGEYIEYLDNLGANSLTVVVKSEDGLTTYRGPNDPSGESDYTLIEGDETTAVGLKRVTTGDIASGDTVLVSYSHDENFTVKYKVNQVVTAVQETVDAARHVTADVLVKEGVKVPVDISATIILEEDAEQSEVDTSVRTRLENHFASLRLGEPLRQSDVVRIIDATAGVSYVVTPLTKMVRGDGSIVVRETLSTDQTGDVTYVSDWSTPSVAVWLIEEELGAATVVGGGSEEDFTGVFQDDVALDLHIVPPQTALGAAPGRGYIIGADGHPIPGISDDDTLRAAGYTTDAEIEAQRKALTANRVLVSLPVDDSMIDHDYTITYIVEADTGVKNIDPGDAEYLVAGEYDFTYDEDR